MFQEIERSNGYPPGCFVIKGIGEVGATALVPTELTGWFLYSDQLQFRTTDRSGTGCI
jgi:hypothetical protein